MDYNFGASGRNKETGTVYSLKKNIKGLNSEKETDSVHASAQKPIHFGGIDNLTLNTTASSIKDPYGDRKAQISFSITAAF